jgi:hypothetical protein
MTASIDIEIRMYLLEAKERARPSYLLRPKLSCYGDCWLAEYFGVLAFGDSPAAAYAEFDRIWLEG